MASYLLIQLEATRPDQGAGYRSAVASMAERFGGRPVIRGAPIQVLQGAQNALHLVVLEFESNDALSRFWHSRELTELKTVFRQEAGECDVWAVPRAKGAL